MAPGLRKQWDWVPNPGTRCTWQVSKPQLHFVPSWVTSEASGVFAPLSSPWLLIQSKRLALCVSSSLHPCGHVTQLAEQCSVPQTFLLLSSLILAMGKSHTCSFSSLSPLVGKFCPISAGRWSPVGSPPGSLSKHGKSGFVWPLC